MARTEFLFPSPYMNAAGALGFSPPGRWPLPEDQGIFIPNPLSASPRSPAGSRGIIPYPGGYLLHSGLPNPGLRVALKKFAPLWARAAYPVWVHLIPATPYDAAWMVREIEGMENVAAIELGLEIADDPSPAFDLLAAAVGELPLVAAVPLNAAGPWLKQLPAAGVSAITLTAPRGSLPSPDGQPVSGRLYGPALFPLVLAAVRSYRRYGLEIIAGAGVWSCAAAQALRAAGAAAVQVDGILWRSGGGWR